MDKRERRRVIHRTEGYYIYILYTTPGMRIERVRGVISV